MVIHLARLARVTLLSAAIVADGVSGAALQGFMGGLAFGFGFGLAKDDAVGYLIVATENGGGKFRAHAAVYALICSVEAAGHIFREAIFEICHRFQWFKLLFHLRTAS